MASSVDPFAGKPADSSSDWTAATPDQSRGVGPPGAAQAAITSWAVTTDPDSIARRSIAISCARAPSVVLGNPVATCA